MGIAKGLVATMATMATMGIVQTASRNHLRKYYLHPNSFKPRLTRDVLRSQTQCSNGVAIQLNAPMAICQETDSNNNGGDF